MKRRPTGKASRKRRPKSGEAALRPGARFGHLRIRRVLGSGGYGTVLLAYDEHVRREVALKVFHPRTDRGGSSGAREELLREARILGRLPHPNIPTLFGVHELPRGGVALEMEHVEGTPLEDLLDGDCPLPDGHLRAILLAVASALAAAHALGLVHGDVKPDNVVCTPDGSAKLIDFGLARIIGAGSSVAAPGGTPQYMAPEVLLGEPTTPASDVWSLGVLLHRMLTGRGPFAAEGLVATFAAVLHSTVPSVPSAPADLDRIRALCLERESGARPASGGDVLAYLEGRRAARAAPRPTASSAAPSEEPGARGKEEAAAFDACVGQPGAETGLALVTGPVGIGKSTLMRAVAARAQAAGRTWIEVHVSSLEGLLQPWIAALQRVLRPPEAGVRSEAAVLGVSALHVERALAELRTRTPLTIGIEDLHHATPEEVRVLQRIVRRLGSDRVGWLVTERTTDLGSSDHGSLCGAPLLALEGSRRVALEALSPDATFQVLQRHSPQNKFEGSVAEPIVRRSRGNPLFAVQMFEYLREQGAVRLEAGRWLPVVGAAHTPTPPALHDLVASRLHALPVSAREVLDAGSVDGLELESAVLAAALDRPLLEVLRALERLAGDGTLVERRGTSYAFAHPLVQEVLYSELSAVRRTEVHRRVATHLEARPDVDPERLGSHWMHAGEDERALPSLLVAARRAAERREAQRATSLAARLGLERRSESDDFLRSHSAVVLWILTCYASQGLHASRDRMYERLRLVAEGAGDASLLRRLAVHRALQRFLGSGIDIGDEDAVRDAEACLEDGPERLRARFLLGLVEKHRGNLDGAEAWFQSAQALAALQGDVGYQSSLFDQRAAIAARRGERRRAAALYSEAAQLARAAGQTTNAAISDVNGCMQEVALGHLTGSQERLRAAERTFLLEGQPRQAATVRVYLAEISYALGDLRAAVVTVREAEESLGRVGYVLGQLPAAIERTHLAIVSGALAEARDCLATVDRLLVRLPDARDRAYGRLFDGQLRLLLGDAGVAEERVRSALDLAARSGEQHVMADIALHVAEWTYFGLSPALLPLALERCKGQQFVEDGLMSVAGVALASMRDVHEASCPPEGLSRAAEALRAGPLGTRRAALLLLAARLEGTAAHRSSRGDDARAIWSAALDDASALGHVWWQVALHRLLAPLEPHGVHTARARVLLLRACRALGEGPEAERFQTNWLPEIS